MLGTGTPSLELSFSLGLCGVPAYQPVHVRRVLEADSLPGTLHPTVRKKHTLGCIPRCSSQLLKGLNYVKNHLHATGETVSEVSPHDVNIV